MIIKHVGTKTVKDEKTGEDKQEPVENDISHLVVKSSWSGARIQAARKLEFTYVQEPRDPNWPVYPIEIGQTIKGYTLFCGKNLHDREKNERLYRFGFVL